MAGFIPGDTNGRKRIGTDSDALQLQRGHSCCRLPERRLIRDFDPNGAIQATHERSYVLFGNHIRESGSLGCRASHGPRPETADPLPVVRRATGRTVKCRGVFSTPGLLWRRTSNRRLPFHASIYRARLNRQRQGWRYGKGRR